MQVEISISKYVNGERISDNWTEVFEPITFEEMVIVHQSLSESNPDSYVNIKWDTSFIAGTRENERLDELKVDSGEMTGEQFKNKWL